MLNSYFSKCWNYSEPLLIDPPERYYPDHLLCMTQEIKHLLKGLDVSKTTGPDGISARMLKATSESIAPLLTSLFNLSITNGHFPKLWKSARVMPISNQRLNIVHHSSYRPISLLSILSKLRKKHFHFLILIISSNTSRSQVHNEGKVHSHSSAFCYARLAKTSWPKQRHMLCICWLPKRHLTLFPIEDLWKNWNNLTL